MSLSPRVARLEAAIPQLHQNIFQCLLAANAAKEVNAVLRVAGGWVRDALLGVPCHDIDIALESPPHAQISGEQFARAVAAYQAEQQPAARERTVSVIRVNPALSKHIETSTLCVCDLPVEFCALRTDDYTDESRIPQVRPATPKEDALRRDFTINALFYNLHTNLVEDYTSGLQDLQSRILRCPLDPAETFHDDPLRLLRGVRFIGQLGALNFRLDDAIPACVTEELLETLLVKVSRERIGKEFVKMLCCAAPSKCIDLLYSMQLLQNVLLAEVHMKTIPGKKKTSAEIDSIVPLVRTVADSTKALKVLRGLNSVITPLFTNPQFFSLQEEEQSSIVLVALLIPFMVGVPPSVSADRLYAVCVNSLKLPLSTYQAVRCMVDSVNALCDGNLSLDELTSPLGMSPQTILKHFEALGFLNDKHVPERAYEVVVLLYIALTACDHCGDGGLEMHAQHDIVQYWSQSWSVLKSHPLLLTAFSMPLPLKGNELKSVIPGLEAKDIGAILLSLRRKLVLHPEMDREAVVQWLQGDRAV